MSMSKNYYEVLEIDHSATQTEIKQQYRNLIAFYHPDNYSGNNKKEQYANEKTKAINEAYSILGDSKKRVSYDRELGIREKEKVQKPKPTPQKPKSNNETTKVCPNCGKTVSIEAYTCKYCEHFFPYTNPTQTSQEKMVECTICLSTVNINASQCSECGSNLPKTGERKATQPNALEVFWRDYGAITIGVVAVGAFLIATIDYWLAWVVGGLIVYYFWLKFLGDI